MVWRDDGPAGEEIGVIDLQPAVGQQEILRFEVTIGAQHMDPAQRLADLKDEVSNLFLVEWFQILLPQLLQCPQADTVNDVLGEKEVVVVGEDFLDCEEILVQESACPVETEEVGLFVLSAPQTGVHVFEHDLLAEGLVFRSIDP